MPKPQLTIKLILFALNILLLQAQEEDLAKGCIAQRVKFISVNHAVDTLTTDTLTEPTKWMVKLFKNLCRKQRKDSNRILLPPVCN